MAVETKIIVADDHPIFRQGLIQVIEKEFGFRVVADADNGKDALELIKNHLPDVAVLDLDMPEIDGFGIASEIQKLNLPVKIVILTMHKDELHFNQAIDLGVSGYVIKDGAAHEVINCIKTVKSGQAYFSPILSTFLLNRVRALQIEFRADIGTVIVHRSRSDRKFSGDGFAGFQLGQKKQNAAFGRR